MIDEIGNLGEEQQPEQSNKFRNLFKRYIEGLLKIWTPPGLIKLTPSQIEGRVRFSYIGKDKINFNIERHGSFIPKTFYLEVNIKDRKIKQTSSEPLYLDVCQFAKHFGYSERKVSNLIRTGQLRAIPTRNLQDQWYESMIESGRENVYNPRQIGTKGSTPWNAYMIPFSEVKRLSDLDKPYEKKKFG